MIILRYSGTLVKVWENIFNKYLSSGDFLIQGWGWSWNTVWRGVWKFDEIWGLLQKKDIVMDNKKVFKGYNCFI